LVFSSFPAQWLIQASKRGKTQTPLRKREFQKIILIPPEERELMGSGQKPGKDQDRPLKGRGVRRSQRGWEAEIPPKGEKEGKLNGSSGGKRLDPLREGRRGGTGGGGAKKVPAGA
jgi:hypothetical protein